MSEEGEISIKESSKAAKLFGETVLAGEKVGSMLGSPMTSSQIKAMKEAEEEEEKKRKQELRIAADAEVELTNEEISAKKSTKSAKMFGEASLAGEKVGSMLGSPMTSSQIKAMKESEEEEAKRKKEELRLAAEAPQLIVNEELNAKKSIKSAKMFGETALAGDKVAHLLGSSMTSAQVKAMKEAEEEEEKRIKEDLRLAAENLTKEGSTPIMNEEIIAKKSSKGAKMLGETSLAGNKAAWKLGGEMSTEQIKKMRIAEDKEKEERDKEEKRKSISSTQRSSIPSLSSLIPGSLANLNSLGSKSNLLPTSSFSSLPPSSTSMSSLPEHGELDVEKEAVIVIPKSVVDKESELRKKRSSYVSSFE